MTLTHISQGVFAATELHEVLLCGEPVGLPQNIILGLVDVEHKVVVALSIC